MQFIYVISGIILNGIPKRNLKLPHIPFISNKHKYKSTKTIQIFKTLKDPSQQRQHHQPPSFQIHWQ